MTTTLTTWIRQQRLDQLEAADGRARIAVEAERTTPDGSSLRQLFRRACRGPGRPPTAPRATPPKAESDAAGSADLAHRLAAHGPRDVENELKRLVDDARRQRVTPVLLSILADPNQPDVVRERAFGRIAVELERAERATSHSPTSVSDAA